MTEPCIERNFLQKITQSCNFIIPFATGVKPNPTSFFAVICDRRLGDSHYAGMHACMHAGEKNLNLYIIIVLVHEYKNLAL